MQPFARYCYRSGYSKNYHAPSVIYWNNSRGLKADYSELFKPIPHDDVKLVENKQWLYNIKGKRIIS